MSSVTLDGILESHLIEPEHLRDDDFQAFYSAREKDLAGLAAMAMGKEAVATEVADTLEDDTTLDEEAGAEVAAPA